MIDLLSYTLKYQGNSLSQYKLVKRRFRIDALLSSTGIIINIFYHNEKKNLLLYEGNTCVIFLNYSLNVHCLKSIVYQP